MLDDIASWSLDAEGETDQRYFRPIPAVRAVLDGEARLVTAARGGGKTALARHIVARAGPDRPAKRVMMTPQGLSALRRSGVGAASEADAAARYLVLFAAFEALLDAGVLAGDDVAAVARAFAVAPSQRLDRLLPQVLDPERHERITRAAPDDGEPLMSFPQALPHIEQALAAPLQGRGAIVLFDQTESRGELGSDFDELEAEGLRVLLAASDPIVRADGPASSVRPVVLARPQIVALVPEAERDAWSARRYDLAWDRDALMQVAGFRVARAASSTFTADQVNAPSVLRGLYAGAARGMTDADWRREGPWPYLWRRTRARPRDMVHVLRASARAARERGVDAIDAEAMARAEQVHSAFMRAEIADELRLDVPGIDVILAGLGALGARRSDVGRLNAVVETALVGLEAGVEATAGARDVIHRLFEASVIGSAVTDGGRTREVYRCFEPEAEFVLSDPIVVHRALASALELVE